MFTRNKINRIQWLVIKSKWLRSKIFALLNFTLFNLSPVCNKNKLEILF